MPADPQPTSVEKGQLAPAFRLWDDEGNVVSLRDFAQAKLVLFAFPRADTPGCTTEVQDFSRLEPDFRAVDTRIVGVSADPPRKLARFRVRRGLTVLLLSDETHDALKAYGAWGEKMLYGRRFEGVLRSTFLIDRESRIAGVWRNVRVGGHADEVLQAAQATD